MSEVLFKGSYPTAGAPKAMLIIGGVLWNIFLKVQGRMSEIPGQTAKRHRSLSGKGLATALARFLGTAAGSRTGSRT